jgi:lysozyme family protein
MSKNFSPILAKTMKYEGNYSHDPDDNGGETYKGIARKFWPKWSGWQVVDLMKTKPGFPSNLEIKDKNRVIPYSQNIQEMVKDFYYENFWLAIGGEKIINDKVAGEIFDTAVNMGIKVAIKLAQEALGLPKEKITGRLDTETLTLLNQIK